MMPFLLHLILFLIPSPALISLSASVPSESQPVKMVISEQCVSDPNAAEGREVDLTPGSPLVLTHRIRLVPGAESGSCCQSELGAFLERMEALEREVSELRQKCGGPDGGCCTSQQSTGPGCTTSADECSNGCSDQGRCVDGKCVCFPGFSGPDCSVPDCPGDCSNKGKCVNGKCVCDPGFNGPDCSVKTCPKNCSNQGRCVNGMCVCDTGFTGPDCSEKSCPGNCNNKGRCVNGMCVCKEGFTGPDCSEKSCPGNCNNKGRCVNGKCVCDTGFTGPDCSEKSCPGNCNNKGRCVNGMCVCKEGFTGPDCSEKSCPGNCNNKGRCVNGKCVCKEGFTGPDCSEKSCPGKCNNKGRCVNGMCVCKEGFTGPDCSERSCPGNCNNKGRCVNGKCVCDTGFTGPDCSEKSCPGNCNNKGRCVNGMCVCKEGFTGPDCSERSCPGNCNNKGRCVNGKCVCDIGFTGPDCSERSCPGNCNNEGRCVNGKCVCDTGFTGPDCSERSCPNNCSNKGSCVNGKCVCSPGFAEPDCSECKDGFSGADCATALIAVSQLSTRNITESSVTLYWTQPTVQYDTYLITFTSEKESDQKITAKVNGKFSTYTQVGLAPGQSYTVTIVGEMDGKMGAKSTTTFQTLISGPKNLEVVKTTTSSVIVQWEEPQGEIDRYRLSVSLIQTDGSGKEIQEMRLPPGRDSAQIDGLQTGRLYHISLVAEHGGIRSLPATVQATPGINAGLPDPASRPPRGSGGKLANLRLTNTTKGSSSQYQSIIRSSNQQRPELSRNVVKPTVMTERNLTAYGINGTKYIRRVWLGHRKVTLNVGSNENAVAKNMSVMVGNISRNDILTNIPDRLAGFSDDVRPLDGKGPKLRDGRFEENPFAEDLEINTQEENLAVHQWEEGAPEMRTISEHPKRMRIEEAEAGTTPLPSLPLATTRVQPSLVPPETQDQPTNKGQATSRDRHYTKTPQRLPSSVRFPGRPKLPGSSTSLVNSRQPTTSIFSTSSSQMPKKVPSLQTSYQPGTELEKTSLQESQPDAQDLPEGTKDTENTDRDNFPKHTETINKTVPLNHRTSQSGTFSRRPNIGPSQSRIRPSQHPYRGPLRRPIMPRVNSTAHNNLELMSSRQGDLNPDQSPVFTRQRKNGTVFRLPPKPQIKPNIKTYNSSEADVRASKETLIVANNDREHKFVASSSTDKVPFERKDTLQPVRGGSDTNIDHISSRVPNRNGTTWKTGPHHPRLSEVFSGRQNASNQKIRPTFIRGKKNSTVVRVPPKIHTVEKANPSMVHSPPMDGKESQPGLLTTPTEEPPIRTSETLQTVNGGSENIIEHLPVVTPRDHESTSVSRERHLPKISRDRNITLHKPIDPNVGSEIIGHRENVPNPNVRSRFILRKKDGTVVRIHPKRPFQVTPNSTSIHSGLEEADTKVGEDATAKGSGQMVGNDNVLPSITNRDLSRITKDQDLPSDITREESFTIKQDFNQNVPPETISRRTNVQNPNLRPKFTPSNTGRVKPKPHGQINQVSTTTQSALADTNPSVQKASGESTGQAVAEGSGSAGGFDSVSVRDTVNDPTPSFTTTFPIRENNETVFRHSPKPKLDPNLGGDSNAVSGTTRTAIPQSTISHNRRPPKVYPQPRPNSTTIHDRTRGSKSYPNDPKRGWSTKVPLATDQTNTTSPAVSEDGISQVEIQSVTSKGFLMLWVAPEGKFKNFVIRIIEKIEQGMDEGDGSKREESKEKTSGKEITANVLDAARRNSSNNGVRKILKLLPGSARSHPVADLNSQTNYSVSLYGTGPGFRSNVHTFDIATGPEPPSHLSFSEITDSSLTVSWRRPKSTVSGFKVTYIHTKEGEPISMTVDSSSSTLSLTELSPGSAYEVSVISVLGLDESDSIKDVVITLPDPPTDLRAINITDTKALLVWRPALATVDQYIITYGAEEDTGSESSVRASGNAVEQQLQALKASTRYRVTINSRLGDQKSSSTQTTFTTASGSPGKGEAPRELTSKHVTARTALLSWKPPASAVTSYKLTYFIKGGERTEVTLNPGVTEHKLRGLHPSSTYTALLQGERGGVYTAAITTEFTTGTLRFPYPLDCSQELMNGETDSGLVEIFPGGKDGEPVMVYCDMETDGGGWTVFQRRTDGQTNFFRGWQEYRKGFGDLEGEFWLGNDFLHNLTAMTPMTLRVDLRSGDDSAFAKYATFSMDTMKKHYALRVSGYSGTAGDSLKYHDKRPFSTFDRDPQPFITRCAMSYRGGWWYKNCHEANLNGQYDTHTNHQGVIWTAWKGKKFSIPFTEMKFRPASFKPNSRG